MSIIRKSDKNDRKKKNFSIGIALLILLVIAILTYAIFEKSGLWLVEDDNFEHVKWVAVLDGQTSDLERSDFAANLLKEGKADSVLLLGRRVFRDRSNSEFYADDFMKLGSFDSNAVFLVPHNDPSTISEAYTLIPWLKARNIDTVLLITSATSTYRVKRIFQKLSGNGLLSIRPAGTITENPVKTGSVAGLLYSLRTLTCSISIRLAQVILLTTSPSVLTPNTRKKCAPR